MTALPYDGVRVSDIAAKRGTSAQVARQWLRDRGYGISDGRARATRDIRELEREIMARIDASPPSAPCFRCGARGLCGHDGRVRV